MKIRTNAAENTVKADRGTAKAGDAAAVSPAVLLPAAPGPLRAVLGPGFVALAGGAAVVRARGDQHLRRRKRIEGENFFVQIFDLPFFRSLSLCIDTYEGPAV